MCPQGRNMVSRLASEHTRHSSAVGSAVKEGSPLAGSAAAALVLATAALGPAAPAPAPAPAASAPPSLSGVSSLVTPEPSLRHVVNVLRRLGSGHKSSGVCPEINNL